LCSTEPLTQCGLITGDKVVPAAVAVFIKYFECQLYVWWKGPVFS